MASALFKSPFNKCKSNSRFWIADVLCASGLQTTLCVRDYEPKWDGNALALAYGHQGHGFNFGMVAAMSLHFLSTSCDVKVGNSFSLLT